MSLEWREPVSDDLLARILAGARDSDLTQNRLRAILVEQGFIDVGEE